MTHPTNVDEARALAVHYVRCALERGYTTVDAMRELYSGMSGPGDPGYEIRLGKITVPMSGKWTFRFADLEAEIKQGEGQMLLML